MNELIKDVGEWSVNTFGGHDRIEDIFNHVKEEADEAIVCHKGKSPFMDWAYADCLILLLDGMYREGISWEKLMLAVKAKMEVNKHKDWSEKETDVTPYACKNCNHQDTAMCLGCPLPYDP